MILRSLELRHFGKFGERNFEFRRGMNLIIGPNEAGKSTLVEAIPAVLFGVRGKERFRPWGRQGSCEAALVLEGRERTVRIERDILSDRVELVERDDLYHNLYQFEGKVSPQGRSSERGEYLEQLTRLFGVADEDIFRASLYFGQGSLEISGQGGMAAKIKTLLSGFVEVDYDRVLHTLQEDYFAVTRQNPWGKDKTRDRELDEVRKRLEQLESRWFAEQGSLKELEDLRAELAELTRFIEAGRSDYDKGERYLAWVRRQWELEDKATQLRRDLQRLDQQGDKVSVLQQRRADIERELQAAGLPRKLPEKLPGLLAESEAVRQDLVAVQTEAAALREQLLELPKPSWTWRLGASLAGLGAAGGMLAWQGEWLIWSAGSLVALLAGVWAPYALQQFRFNGDMGELQEQGRQLEERRLEVQTRLSHLDEQFEALGLRISSVERVKMLRNLDKHRELANQLREVESALGVLEAEGLISAEKETLLEELAQIEERLENERPKQREALLGREDLPEAEEKLRTLGEELREKENRLLELTRREAALQGELADLERIEEEGARLREAEAQLARRAQSLRTAFDLLNESVEEFRQTYLERFSADIGQALALVTSGRYAEVRLEDDFRLLLRIRGNQWQPVEHFSRGTVDAVYFAVRLALTRHLARGRHLPLLLDDPLVNLDATRLADTLQILEQISAEHQVVLLAHDERLLRQAARGRWNVIPLEQVKTPSPQELQERNEDVRQLYLL
ncbi:ATP-binding protein [Geoalkalibacter halelectricus]|uniref:AAA family ATPase n=1 Tax=Geoalkalibacter halelectricus TaxID=2847045 RepID=A0ABY5ZH05_9BACT|nr:AAA family ATPase [Geoalkalibacter halelectricus]MDO3376604.1 AAA family ATPase [Geoalkalibacter halelectricus]UWZ78437.1 AAA family ATPase [Geoalkalibacter halelectricus]